jgi:1-acyl-sn-glycerol-3-phosphate acyltransferase
MTAARDAAIASLRTNAPIVPIAAYGSDLVPRPLARLRRQKLVVVIGEPFHPETSSVDELLGDIRAILLHLEDLARARAGQIASPAHAMAR